ncbi:restriction endonuclease subunit S [Testudinibacter sp. P80/BLE/0925]|uniref:restriction endonuclease subunit S n=1 Tax=Testudinibacter sp. TW-1 TaxID=3417757 RepID=UPI003D35DCD3
MKKLSDYVQFGSGSPQFRVTESTDSSAPVYIWYAQHHLAADLSGMATMPSESKSVATFDKVCLLASGDVVFSLISGKAAMVGEQHGGMIQTQNYIKLLPEQGLDAAFLVYLLNENRHIKKQWAAALQGSSVLKYTLAQLKALTLTALPPLEKQKIIGNIYLMQQRLQALKQQAAERQTQQINLLLAGASEHE